MSPRTAEGPAEHRSEARVRAIVDIGGAAAADTAVFVVASLKDHGGNLDVLDVQTEFLSETELGEIVGGCRKAGFYCDPFTDPAEFCRWASAGGGDHFPFRNRAVYSIAQPGRSASRHAPLAGIAEFFGFLLLTPPAFEACLSHHKAYATQIMAAAGVPTPATWCYDAPIGWLGASPPAGEPVIAKPCLESASIGMDVSSRFEFGPSSEAYLHEMSLHLAQPVVVQAFVRGREVEIPVLNDGRAFALDPVGIALDGRERLDDSFLDYATVYDDGYTFYDFAQREPALSEHLTRYAARSAEALGLLGLSRFDFRIDDDGRAYAMDMTGKPHLTRHSSVAFRFDAMGFGYHHIFAALVGSALTTRALTRAR
jgi:D-alanine-D-alanine ligase